MTVFDDMQEIRAALGQGDVLTEAQLSLACDIVLARPTGSGRFATALIWALGHRVAEQRALIAELEQALGEEQP